MRMNSNKIEKKLPDEIIALIDYEASSKGLNRQDVISHLVSAVKGAGQVEENKRIKKDYEILEKQRDEDKKEIRFLRDEISKFSSGLTSLAITIGESKGSADQISTIAALSDQMKGLSEEISLMKQDQPKEYPTMIDKNLPLIMISVLAALLLIFLILSKVVS